jgi:hypothetical protein
MKKFLYSIFIIIIFLFAAVVLFLSTIGLETSKFNNLIIKEIAKKDSKTKIELEKIKIKLDLKKFQLFLSTNNPKIVHQDVKIPITEVKIYSKINKILNSKIEINQIIFSIKNFEIKDLQKVAVRIKPSNFKTYLLNNLEGGKIEKAAFDLSINKNFKILNYQANGKIIKINTKIKNNFIIKDLGFNFIIDKNLTLINSINASYEGVLISNGSINVQRNKEIEVKGKFNSQFNLDEKQLNKFFTKVKFFKENKIKTQGLLLHEFNLKINEDFKIINYDYKSNGDILESQLTLKDTIKKEFIENSIKKILIEKTNLEINFNKQNKNILLLNGLYSTDKTNYKKFKVRYNLDKKIQNYFIDLDLTETINLNLINFQSNSGKKNNLKSEFTINNNILLFKSIDYTEGKNYISVKGLKLNKKNEIKSISSIRVLTSDENKKNNDFTINFGKKIFISGDRYDYTNLLKIISGDTTSNVLKNFSKEVVIELKELMMKSEVALRNLNLIGLIERGKFIKLSAKSEFSKDKYLDISLKKDPNNKKILEIYSDSPQALLTNYKFFEGIKDGKLLYNSVIDEKGSASKITIENFKVVKAPAFATLLTLADLSGFADLLSGQGMSFDILEINLREDANVTTVDEILALGGSVSLQMSGYIEKKTGLVSLSGTLVPAKMLNNLVSRIPVVGNILVGDKAGEGVFGVSFKIKGLPENVKTTVNPVKTITPRFITRALEKMKKN